MHNILVPFDGLGFELSGVRLRAARMTLRVLAPARSRSPIPAEPPCRSGRSGYGLLLSLSREIRGR